VIIPTFCDSRLKFGLSALNKQTYPKNLYEIIVVNNDANSTIPDETKLLFKDVIFINEHKEGSYAARNTGIKHSSGCILAFTDSDCIPNTKWIEEGVRMFSNKNIGTVGGKIDFFSERNLDYWSLIEKFDSLTYPQYFS
jgi:glycosyltransferase involved in cell wall biosynthesis